MARRIFIHCGLHKTGTTALQVTCARNRALLLQAGVLFPDSRNRAFDGHHNLAWGITRDWRFDAGGLTAQLIADEIADFPGDAVISSEDFESVLHEPVLLDALVSVLAPCCAELRIVVYFRDRRGYAESLYTELMRHGYTTAFSDFAGEIARTGQVRYRRWVFQFDDASVQAALRAWRPDCLIARDYERIRPGGSVVGDFLSVLGVPAEALPAAAHARLHQRMPAAEAFALFAMNRLGRDLGAIERNAVSDLFCQVPGASFERVFSAATLESVLSRSSKAIRW